MRFSTRATIVLYGSTFTVVSCLGLVAVLCQQQGETDIWSSFYNTDSTIVIRCSAATDKPCFLITSQPAFCHDNLADWHFTDANILLMLFGIFVVKQNPGGQYSNMIVPIFPVHFQFLGTRKNVWSFRILKVDFVSL